MDAELKQYLIEMEERIVSSLKGYVNERCELVETKLLTEFHKWASPAEARNPPPSPAPGGGMEMEATNNGKKKGRRPPAPPNPPPTP